MGRRNWRWGGDILRGGLSGSVVGELKNGRHCDRREGVSRGRKLTLQAEGGVGTGPDTADERGISRGRDWTLETGSRQL